MHLPKVKIGEPAKKRIAEADSIIEVIWKIDNISDEGIITVKRYSDNKLLKIINLVNDNPEDRKKGVDYLNNIKSKNDLDLIIALSLSKENIKWVYCENTITVR